MYLATKSWDRVRCEGQAEAASQNVTEAQVYSYFSIHDEGELTAKGRRPSSRSQNSRA